MGLIEHLVKKTTHIYRKRFLNSLEIVLKKFGTKIKGLRNHKPTTENKNLYHTVSITITDGNTSTFNEVK